MKVQIDRVYLSESSASFGTCAAAAAAVVSRDWQQTTIIVDVALR